MFDTGSCRLSASSRTSVRSEAGSVTDILILGSPSSDFLPAFSRAPPLPNPPMINSYKVYAKINIKFEKVILIQIKYVLRHKKRP